MLLLSGFILCAVVIIAAGIGLSRYGDVIAEKAGLGRAWTGMVLLATVTSLPEFVNGISSVTIAGAPDIAAGDLMGACVFNLITLALLDPMDKGSPVFRKAGQSHLLSSAFGIALLGKASVSIMAGPVIPSVYHIGLYTPLIIYVYIFGVRLVYLYEKNVLKKFAADVEKVLYPHVSAKKAVFMYSLNALAVIGAASILPFLASGLSDASGLGKTFMGTVFVALVTTLPEMAVSFSAIRIGAHDLAIGNLLGSNMFNMALLAVDDVFFLKGPLLSNISGAHAVTGLMAILMTSVALIGIISRPGKRAFLRFGWGSLAILALGALNVYFLSRERS
ncbi:MAG: sodium:calcium antiporter [Deltaproteobacteria bacterium]|nr:sodium:calcium antiporter [Deltaproteobacteria bacterium]